MIEELFIAGTKIIRAFTVTTLDYSVLGTAATTERKVSAHRTFIGKTPFFAGEDTLGVAVEKFADWGFQNISQFPPLLDEKIAAEYIAIMLHHNIFVASIAKSTIGMMALKII